MMSDDSENDIPYDRKRKHDPYYIKYKLLMQECVKFQRENEKLVFRLREVNKITKRRYKEVQFFRQRLLNIHGQDWSVIPPEVLSDLTDEEEEKPHPTQVVPKKEVKQEKPDEPGVVKDKAKLEKLEKPKLEKKLEKPKPVEKPKTLAKRPPRRKVPKSERDPNAPKRPSNPFFQFCQEQRQPLMEQICSELKPFEVEPSKQELTRQLAIKWNSLSTSDKKVYVDRYERSKEKYNAQMEDYKKTKE
ncbi:unnamed protein product [Ceutorhynchus assimilis]|uniref:HMG box domain-containing protein n=1 Tax=Ceutorhynchus assimilis TaxID=467358 RepID=A0A9N9N067_9CUCU|nr:unnamed protein product [Ceutorhynchus assimilis]